MLESLFLFSIFCLLLLAGFFALAEASLFALTRYQLESLRQSRFVYQRIAKLLEHPEELLSTLVISNELVSVGLGTLFTMLLRLHWELSPVQTALLSILTSACLLLTVSEIIPKVFAFRFPKHVSMVVAYPLSSLYLLLTPLRSVLLAISRLFLQAWHLPVGLPPSVGERDLLTLIELGAQSGSLEQEETSLIANVFQFSDVSVQSLMTPWNKTITIPSGLSPELMLERIRAISYSRIPVWDSPTRSVTGVLHTKTLLKLLLSDAEDKSGLLTEAILPPHFVGGRKKAARLFREMQKRHIHLSIVVDDLGKPVGIVSLEDILNALFRLQRV